MTYGFAVGNNRKIGLPKSKRAVGGPGIQIAFWALNLRRHVVNNARAVRTCPGRAPVINLCAQNAVSLWIVRTDGSVISLFLSSLSFFLFLTYVHTNTVEGKCCIVRESDRTVGARPRFSDAQVSPC